MINSHASHLFAEFLDTPALFGITDRPVARHFKLDPPFDVELGVTG